MPTDSLMGLVTRTVALLSCKLACLVYGGRVFGARLEGVAANSAAV